MTIPASPKQDKKALEKLQEDTLREGRFAAVESEKNSVAVSDDSFVGVDTEYKNYANETDMPYDAEGDDDELTPAQVAERNAFAAVKESEADPTKIVTHPFLAYNPDTTHPSERKTASAQHIEEQRELTALQLQIARQQASGTTSDDEAQGGEGGDGEASSGEGGTPPAGGGGAPA